MSFSSQRCCGDCSLCASASQHALRCLHLHFFWCPLAWQPFLHLVARLARALLGVPRGPRRWLTPWATARQGSVSLYRWLHSRESLVESPASRSSNGLAPPKSIMGSPAQRDCVQGSRFTSTFASSCQDFLTLLALAPSRACCAMYLFTLMRPSIQGVTGAASRRLPSPNHWALLAKCSTLLFAAVLPVRA